MSQNTEYFGLYRNSQLRSDVTPTSRMDLQPRSVDVWNVGFEYSADAS